MSLGSPEPGKNLDVIFEPTVTSSSLCEMDLVSMDDQVRYKLGTERGGRTECGVRSRARGDGPVTTPQTRPLEVDIWGSCTYDVGNT